MPTKSDQQPAKPSSYFLTMLRGQTTNVLHMDSAIIDFHVVSPSPHIAGSYETFIFYWEKKFVENLICLFFVSRNSWSKCNYCFTRKWSCRCWPENWKVNCTRPLSIEKLHALFFFQLSIIRKLTHNWSSWISNNLLWLYHRTKIDAIPKSFAFTIQTNEQTSLQSTGELNISRLKSQRSFSIQLGKSYIRWSIRLNHLRLQWAHSHRVIDFYSRMEERLSILFV